MKSGRKKRLYKASSVVVVRVSLLPSCSTAQSLVSHGLPTALQIVLTCRWKVRLQWRCTPHFSSSFWGQTHLHVNYGNQSPLRREHLGKVRCHIQNCQFNSITPYPAQAKPPPPDGQRPIGQDADQTQRQQHCSIPKRDGLNLAVLLPIREEKGGGISPKTPSPHQCRPLPTFSLLLRETNPPGRKKPTLHQGRVRSRTP